jgi:hypothetical protein
MRHAASRNVADSAPNGVTEFFFSEHNSLSRTMAPEFTPPLTAMNTGRFEGGGKSQPACKADKLTTIYEPTV